MSYIPGHRGSFQVITRAPGGHATRWQSSCQCGARPWTGPDYEAAEDEWRRHVWAETGTAPAPMGDKAGRWEPAVVAVTL